MSREATTDLLILDYGGVYSFDYNLGSYDTIMQNTFGTIPDPEEQKDIESISRRLSIGQISTRQYVISVARRLRTQPPSPESFEENTIALTHDPSPEMVNLVSQAKKEGIRVALLSNMYLFEVTKTKPWGRYDKFDYAAFSAESHLTKSDPEFFICSMKHFGAIPSRTLFVDDVAAYVHTAEKLGVRTIHADKKRFSNAAALADAIRVELQI